MKTDLATSIIAAIAGIALAFFVTNLLLPPTSEVKFSTLSGKESYSITEPDDEIFNYRALNPTVEVYVGSEGQ